jgi:hypothetical protein
MPSGIPTSPDRDISPERKRARATLANAVRNGLDPTDADRQVRVLAAEAAIQKIVKSAPAPSTWTPQQRARVARAARGLISALDGEAASDV